MKKTIIIIFSVFIVLIAAIVIAPSFIDWNQYKPEIKEQIAQTAGYEVNISGDLGLALIPTPYLYATDVEIRNPAENNNVLAQLETLEVSLAFLPLLQGNVAVRSVSFIEPHISLLVDDQGNPNWMTPELRALAEPGVEESSATDTSPGSGMGGSVSIDKLYIENGRFSYQGQNASEALVFSELNGEAKIDSIQGPFDFQGDFKFQDRKYEVEGNLGSIADAKENVSAQLRVNVQPENLEISYAGVLDIAQPYAAQGELKASTENVLKILGVDTNEKQAGFKLSSLVTASEKQIDLKDLRVSIGDSQFEGYAGAMLEPLSLDIKIDGNDTLNLDSLLPNKQVAMAQAQRSQGQEKGGGNSGFLPESLALPAGFDASLEVNAPGLVYQNNVYRSVSLRASKKQDKFSFQGSLSEIPGGGNAEIDGSLQFEGQSADQSGGSVIYQQPELKAKVKLRSQNIAETLTALAGKEAARNVPAEWKAGGAVADIVVGQDAIILTDMRADFGTTNLQASGRYSLAAKRPKITLDAAMDQLDLNLFLVQEETASTGDGKTKESLEKTIESFSLPYDLAFDVGVQELKYADYDISGLRAQGTLEGEALKLENLSVQNYAGAAFKVNGEVGNLSELSQIQLGFEGQVKDFAAFSDQFNLDLSRLPQSVKAVSLSGSANGNLNQLQTSVAIRALGGQLKAEGNVSDPLANLKAENVKIQVLHQNVNEALRIFAPSGPSYSSWNKPMNISFNLQTTDKGISFDEIKGDIAGASVAGSLGIETAAQRPTVQGSLVFGDVIMKTGFGSGAAKTTQVRPQRGGTSNRWPTDKIDTALLRGANLDIDLRASSLVYDGWDLQKPSTKFVLNNGTLTLNSLEAGLFGGQVNVTGNLGTVGDAAEALSFDMTADLENVDLENLISAFIGTPIIQGSGQVSLKTQIKSTGTSQRALVQALAGSGSMSGSHIVIQGFDVARFAQAVSLDSKPGDTALGLWRSTTAGGSTSFSSLDGSYQITNGVVDIAQILLTGPTADLKMTGTVDLPAWYLDTQNTITVKGTEEEIPPFNLKIAGPLDNPAQTFGQGVLQNYLSQKLERKIGKELDRFIGEKLGLPGRTEQGDPQEVAPSGGDGAERRAPSGQPIQPEEAIRGVLEGLLGGGG